MAGSNMTLPVLSAISIILWLVMPYTSGQSNVYHSADYGLWCFVPSLSEGVGAVVSLAVVALCVYLMAELNNTIALLRITSRIISSLLALLCGMAVALHLPQPGLVLMFFTLVAFFPLFQAYQYPSPLLTFCIFLSISVSSFVFPKSLMLVPVYWLIYLRSFSFRCFVASLLALALPYWLCFGTLFVMGRLDVFVLLVSPLASWHWGNYSQLALGDVFTFGFMFLLFAVGVVDFIINSFYDKTHTRLLYSSVIFNGFCVAVFIILQPQFVDVLLPVFIIDAAILFGHFFALTYTRASHIICLVLAALAIFLITQSFIPLPWNL